MKPPFISAERGATFDVLVENMGRVNYGASLTQQFKGMSFGSVDGRALDNWKMFSLSCAAPSFRLDAPTSQRTGTRVHFLRGNFELRDCGATFFDMRAFGKGVLWVNGRCAGRFWNIGPQRDLYVPASWLHLGRNEAVVLELLPQRATPLLQGRTERDWSVACENSA